MSRDIFHIVRSFSTKAPGIPLPAAAAPAEAQKGRGTDAAFTRKRLPLQKERQQMKFFFRTYYIKQDRKALIFLLLVILLSMTAVYFAGERDNTATAVDSVATAKEDSVKTPDETKRNDKTQTVYAVEKKKNVELFPFDPNTADSTDLLRLGLQPWQVRNIYKYRAAGGIYRKPADFANLYGLTAGQYKALEPYIRISPDYLPASTLFEEKATKRDSTWHTVKLSENETVPLNTTDTAELKRVPGIGSWRARQIVSYGERLGGYASVDQLDEIAGFPPSAKKFFTVDTTGLRKINVNKASLDQLKSHPYINFHQAKAILDYRRLRGNIDDIRELSLSKDFTEEDLTRIEPYVEY